MTIVLALFYYSTEDIRRHLPIYLSLIVFYELYSEFSQEFSSNLEYVCFMGLILSLSFIVAKVIITPKHFNLKNYTFNEEILITILVLLRVAVYAQEGIRPIRNPLYSFDLIDFAPSLYTSVKTSAIIWLCTIFYILFVIRIFAMMNLYNSELKGVFEIHYKKQYGNVSEAAIQEDLERYSQNKEKYKVDQSFNESMDSQLYSESDDYEHSLSRSILSEKGDHLNDSLL